jgi:hypothetical protein
LAYEGYTALLPQQSVLSADNLLIGIGVAMFVVAFFGCCGSWFQSRCMLVMVSFLQFTLHTLKNNSQTKNSKAKLASSMCQIIRRILFVNILKFFFRYLKELQLVYIEDQESIQIVHPDF